MKADRFQSVGYRKLCTLTLFHEYVNGVLHTDNYVLLLSPDMQQFCRNQGLIVKQTYQGISVLYAHDEAKASVDDNICLHLGIRFVDPEFFLFSSAGLNPYGTVLSCSNEAVQTSGDFQCLHQGDVIDEQYVQPVSEQDSDDFAGGVSLLVLLNLKTLIAQAHNDTGSVSSPFTEYAIRFAAREVPWLYWFWLKQGKLKNLIEKDNDFLRLDLQINGASTGNEGIAFKQLDDVVVMNQQRGVRFISSKPIKLGAESDFTLSLIYQDDMGEKLLIDYLPHPAKDCLEMLAVENERKIVASSHVSL